MRDVEFKGECKGVRLSARGAGDDHICLQILTEDDEQWFASSQPFSSSWIDELIEQLQRTKLWLQTQEPDIYDGRQYGYKFTSKI